MNESTEISMGRKYHPEIIKKLGKYDNPALQEYITKVGNRLAASSHRSNLIYRFTVLDSADVNAFALPGGYIYITRGLLAYLNTEDELAAVLGHEIGHVTARHGVRQQTASTAANIGLAAGQIFFPELRNKPATDAYGLLGGILLSKYSREHELESDSLSAEYLAKAGYEPMGIMKVLKVLKNHADFNQKLAASQGEKTSTYRGLFASHPDTNTRIRHIINSVTPLKKRNKIKKSSFPQILSGLVFGDNFSEGIRRGSRVYHGPLEFAVFFPGGWVLKNGSRSIEAFSPGKTALIRLTVHDINKRIPCKEFLTHRLGFKNLRHGKEIRPHNLKGYTGLVELKGSSGNRFARVCLIFFNNRAYLLTGIAKDIHMQIEIDKKVLQTGLSFHPLSKKEKRLAEPLKLKLIHASKTKYKKLAKKSPIPVDAESYLRLLNQQYPKGEPKPGQLIKIVQ